MTGASAHDIAKQVASGETTASAVIESTLAGLAAQNPTLNCCTQILADDARRAARALDARIAAGEPFGPLAGVPFLVKDMFDMAGRTTLAGSASRVGDAPADRDASLVARLKEAGAIPVALTNMDEFAYGFTTENGHYGTTRNPHDLGRVAGGSSGGSAAGVAAGLTPLAIASDTNGSVRVPAAFCGIWGLKPTFGRLTRAGTFPFVASLDHVGVLARAVADLALAYDCAQGPDPDDPAQVARPVESALPGLDAGIAGLRIGVLGGWFRTGATPEALAAVDGVAQALGLGDQLVDLPEAQLARSAAYIITAAEGGALHLPVLRERPETISAFLRPRLIAGALLPAALVLQAQRFRRRFQLAAASVFERYDILLAPATPYAAIRIGQKTMVLDGVEVSAPYNLGIYTQPISFIGLPVVAAPIVTAHGLPHGVQIIAAPWQEVTALRVAAYLERAGIASAPVATGSMR